ncbi:hypothetical protein ACFQ0K_03820 [Nocardioides caeni]|uniref:Uncharacterized protein n=1 Tax=Nocardioides caeni TaxID=574700 RepID=A0A4S8N0S7_9ACTN|nr:hypothetical protein [Nocardioides caeni]THV09061.1 hypothetical protein E9934_17920 [Nocardioides caeni]
MSTVVRSLLLSAFLTLVPVTIGVVVSDDTTPEREPVAYTGTALADYDTTTTAVQRAEFCDLLPAEAATEALDAEATGSAYGNGDASDIVPGGDVAHEYGCRFVPADDTADDNRSGIEARAWVFAPPVTADRATMLIRAAQRTRGCTVDPAAPAYGAPSVAVQCTSAGRRTASFRGLFGDAWLSCSLSLPDSTPIDDLVDRAGRWCVAVALAASA